MASQPQGRVPRHTSRLQPHVAQKYGHIVNVSSVSGKFGHVNGGAIVHLNSAVVGFTETTNNEENRTV